MNNIVYIIHIYNKRMIPENFKVIIADFTKDLSITYTEYSALWEKWTTERTSAEYEELFQYCVSVYPERFFDILYQNEEIFQQPVYFLPNIDFAVLYNTPDISENTKNVLWKYLQLILFTIVGTMKDKTGFGDTTNLFEGIDESELQTKLHETMENMSSFFQQMGFEPPSDGDSGVGANEGETGASEGGSTPAPESFPFHKMDGMPNVEELHEHLQGLLGGKIGALAKELAEEISGDITNMFGDNMQNIRTTQDFMKSMLKDPKKMTEIMKKITTKFDKKMKSGEISQEDLMRESKEIIEKMKSMGGANSKEFQDMMKNMAKGMGMNMPKGARIDTNALKKMEEQMNMREKMKAKLEAKRQAGILKKENENYIFTVDGETQERSGIRPPSQAPKYSDEELIKTFESDKPAPPTPQQKAKSSNKKKKPKK